MNEWYLVHKLPVAPTYEISTLLLKPNCSRADQSNDKKCKWSKFCRTAHCSYLNIYISRKIRFCLGDMQGKVRVNSLTKSIIFFLSVNSNLLYSFMLHFLKELSNPVLITHCCCCSKELTCLNSSKFVFQINYTEPDFSWNVNVQIATVCSLPARARLPILL